MMKLIKFLLILLLLPLPSFAAKSYLYQWDSGSDHTWPGWTWTDSSYDRIGFRNDSGQQYGSAYYGPYMFFKYDYGSSNNGIVDSTDRAPSTTTGGSFKYYDIDPDGPYQPSWWLWYDGQNLGQSGRGITSTATDRMSMYLKVAGMADFVEDGGSNSLHTNMHVGTYLCFDGSCPYEGPGNEHFYHYLSVRSGAWVHVLLDTHPNIRRGPSYNGYEEVSQSLNTQGYFDALHQFYMEVRAAQSQPTSVNLDEMYFYSTSDGTVEAEPAQNDLSICNIWVGYWPSEGKWRIGFNDLSFATGLQATTGLGDTTLSTFEIRWSTSPITNANWDSATPIVGELYSGAHYTGSINTALIRREEGWSWDVYTRFELPDNIEAANDKIYFAVKDVSSSTGNAGTSWPWNVPDGHNAPSSNIHTIDYDIRPSSTPTPIDGVCGSSDGGSFASAPTINLCATGTASAVSGTTSFSWTCAGINGGDPASCSASLASGSISAWLTSGGSILTSSGAVLTPAQ